MGRRSLTDFWKVIEGALEKAFSEHLNDFPKTLDKGRKHLPESILAYIPLIVRIFCLVKVFMHQ